ncbi:MAG: EF-P beta-lysylation protein EpmB [Bermanella sp.]
MTQISSPQSIEITPEHHHTWQQQLADVVSSAHELLKELNLSPEQLPDMQLAAKDFPIRVPRAYLKRIQLGDFNDPLLRQILPSAAENTPPPPGFVLDPLGEVTSNKTPGIVHKYHGRVLLITNGSCAIHCRYCFRRHFPYDENNLSSQQWREALSYISEREEINEVILSGGDPLTNNDKRLFSLIEAIEAIPHISRLRIHTRLPIVIPSRITAELIERLAQSRLNIVMVVHCNHANEIDDEVASILRSIQQSGIHVLNQSVLLKDINDNVATLVNLSERLFSCGVLPYYLHLLDKVIGAHHFEVKESEGQNLMLALQNKLPGFLLPKLVKEIDGMPSKTSIATPLSPI